MRRGGSLALLLGLALAPPAAGESRPPVGLVQRLEVTAITRDRITLWVRAALGQSIRGDRQSFTGKLDIANVVIPFHAPARVVAQPGGGGAGPGSDAVFFLEVDLPKVPEELLSRVGAHALDLTLDGVVAGPSGAAQPVFAVGVLRFGTPDVKTPQSANPDFLRFGGARLTEVALTETNGEASVILYNPFSFAVPIRELAYELVVGERVLASGVRHAVRIRPRQETTVSLPVTARNVDLAAAAGSALLGRGVLEGRLVGHLTVKVASGDVTLPINLPGRVELRQ